MQDPDTPAGGDPEAPDRVTPADGADGGDGERPARPATDGGEMPDYRGAPLDAERGPGLGCFWLQVIVLAVLLVLTPITVVLAFPPWVSATMLIVSLVVLLFVGQTTIFLLRLVAADRRTRRRPRSAAARKTVGQLEEEAAERGDERDGPTPARR
jgi:hypothetical protein